MPHLVQMDKRYGKKGLQIIGAEVQRSSAEAIAKITKEYKVTFPITKGISGPITGTGIPRSVVFDATGKVVFLGHPGDKRFERAVKTALRDVKNLADDKRKSSLPEVAKPIIESRSWTNETGKKIVASVLEINGDKVLFKLSNGKKVSYPVTQLSEDDQEMIKEAQSNKDE